MSSLLQKSGKILHHHDYEKKIIIHTTNASKNIFFFEEMIQETKNKGQLLFKLTKILGFLKGLQFS